MILSLHEMVSDLMGWLGCLKYFLSLYLGGILASRMPREEFSSFNSKRRCRAITVLKGRARKLVNKLPLQPRHTLFHPQYPTSEPEEGWRVSQGGKTKEINSLKSTYTIGEIFCVCVVKERGVGFRKKTDCISRSNN